MPTYDYNCARCGDFESVQKITATPLKRCPSCGRPVRRLISRGAGVLFKGSGFYQTDYRSEGYKQSAAADKPVAAPKAEAAGDSKKKAPETSKAKKP